MSQPRTTTAATTSTLLAGGVDPGPLFAPFSLGRYKLTNRFVMAPMTRQFSPGGVPGENVAAYYARRAPHVGLIITEGTYVDHPSAGSSHRVPRFYGADALAGWTEVVRAVHAVGGRIMPQLWHLGAHRAPGAEPHPEAPVFSPSGVHADGSVVGEPATTAEIDALVASFARAGQEAARVGFDGIELHGAHGYGLDQFFWSRTNLRSDKYGATLGDRARIGAEVVAAIRNEVGPDFPIVYRYSQWKGTQFDARIADTPAELAALLTPFGRRRRHRLSCLDAPVLGAGLRGLAPHLGRVDEAAHRTSDRRARLYRGVYPVSRAWE